MSLLPGLRDLRAPLAAGFVWLTLAWLAIGDRFPYKKADAKGLLYDVYNLAETAGRPAVSVALAFIAYIIGIVAIGLTSRIVFTFADFMTRRIPRFVISSLYLRSNASVDPVFSEAYETVMTSLEKRYDDDALFRDQIKARITEEVRHEVAVEMPRPDFGPRDLDVSIEDLLVEAGNGGAVRRRLLEATILSPELAAWITSDLHTVPQRIIDKMSRTYDRYDQLRAESEFSAAVGGPLLLLPLALGLRMSLSLLLVVPLIIPGVTLLIQSRRRGQMAAIQLISIVKDNPDLSPPLRRIGAGSVVWSKSPFHWDRRRRRLGEVGWHVSTSFTLPSKTDDDTCDVVREACSDPTRTDTSTA